MMVIRGSTNQTPAVFAGIHTFINTGGRTWAPDSFLTTALAGRKITGISQTDNSITTLESQGVASQEAFRNAALPHIHFDAENNLIIDNSFSPLQRFVAGDRLVVANNALMTVPEIIAYRIYPADRCTWRQTYEAGLSGYQIYDALFYPGAGTTVSETIVDAALGYIGKSGRFIEIAG